MILQLDLILDGMSLSTELVIMLVAHILSLVCTGHPWVQVDGLAPDKPLDSAVISRLKQFSAMNKLKKIAIRVGYNLFY